MYCTIQYMQRAIDGYPVLSASQYQTAGYTYSAPALIESVLKKRQCHEILSVPRPIVHCPICLRELLLCCRHFLQKLTFVVVVVKRHQRHSFLGSMTYSTALFLHCCSVLRITSRFIVNSAMFDAIDQKSLQFISDEDPHWW